jgi:hypothetical protein
MDLQKKGRYDIIYQKAQQLGGRTSKAIRTFGIEDNQGNLVTEHRQAHRIWDKYLQNLYDSENRPKDIAIEAKTNWMKMTKDLLYLKVR